LEAQAGLPIIRRINPGPERYNLKYIRARNLGAYTPDKAEFIRSLEELSYNLERVIEQNATFRTRAEKERSAALKRTEEMAYFVERMAVDEEFATMLPTSGVSHRAQAGFRLFQPSTRPLLTTLLNRSTPRVKHKRTVLEKVPAEKQE
jgi:hypothetical protein